MLKVEELNVYYDKIHAVKGVSFEVRDGEICTLIGANGAGKTTILQTISGLLRPKSGKISFDGVDITGHSPNKILVRALAQVPEGRRVFGQMTVLETLEMGAFTRRDTAGIREDLEMVFHSFPRLKERLRSAGRHPVRRRTADACHGSGTHVPSEDAPAGRTLHGSGSHSGGRDLL